MLITYYWALFRNAIRIMSKRSRPEKGFYRYLHSRSSVDLLPTEGQVRPIKQYHLGLDGDSTTLPEGVFEVERVIHQRKSGKVSMQLRKGR